MDFQPSERAQSYAQRVRAFIDQRIAPVEAQHWKEIHEARHGGDWTQWKVPARVEELKAQAKAEGLWNLFLPDADLAPGLEGADLENRTLFEILETDYGLELATARRDFAAVAATPEAARTSNSESSLNSDGVSTPDEK